MDNDNNREEQGDKAVKLGIIGNVILTVLNLIVGIISGSTALTAEAADNFGDMISSLIGFLAFHFALKPADKEHPYGHGRIEPLVGLLISFTLFFIAYQIFQEAYFKFLMHSSLTAPDWIAAIMALIALFINLYMAYYLLKTGKKINSQVISATGNQKKIDVFACIAVFGGVIGSQLGYPILDDEIRNVVFDIKGVKFVRNIKINTVGPYYSVELEVCLDDKMDFNVYEISDQVEKIVIKSIELVNSVSVHVSQI
jgi:divalent metal cation (Fe/Co/Zn/Cd) transporter